MRGAGLDRARGRKVGKAPRAVKPARCGAGHSSSRSRSAGSGARTVQPRSGDRVRERDGLGMERLAGTGLERGRDRRGRDVPRRPRHRRRPGRATMGWPSAARCTRIWCVRPVSGARRSSVAPRKRSTTSKRVTAARPRRVPDAHALALPRVTADRLVDHAGAGVAPRRAPRRRSASRACVPGTAAPAPRAPAACARPAARPRCRGRAGARCPGRSGSPTPASAPRRCSSAFTTVPRRAPGAGCTTMPGGLSMASRCASS